MCYFSAKVVERWYLRVSEISGATPASRKESYKSLRGEE